MDDSAARTNTGAHARDMAMMRRCIALSAGVPRMGELPIASIVCDGDRVIAETTNQVRCEGDVSRHAEILAIACAQRTLKHKSLSRCTLYATVEPCPMCSFAIREAGVGKVVYALTSPVMGGLSKWNILRDRGLSDAIPQVFGPVPEVIAGLLWREAAAVWWRWNPVIWAFIKHRGFFGPPPAVDDGEHLPAPRPARGRLRALFSLGVWR
ncbi:MAG TPA: nucleoside deaminase [Pseudolabrys sp.]|nr:nucleoside deaminase [Pseudolabrys sp.]